MYLISTSYHFVFCDLTICSFTPCLLFSLVLSCLFDLVFPWYVFLSANTFASVCVCLVCVCMVCILLCNCFFFTFAPFCLQSSDWEVEWSACVCVCVSLLQSCYLLRLDLFSSMYVVATICLNVMSVLCVDKILISMLFIKLPCTDLACWYSTDELTSPRILDSIHFLLSYATGCLFNVHHCPLDVY